jgi:hypothetical protein
MSDTEYLKFTDLEANQKNNFVDNINIKLNQLDENISNVDIESKKYFTDSVSKQNFNNFIKISNNNVKIIDISIKCVKVKCINKHMHDDLNVASKRFMTLIQKLKNIQIQITKEQKNKIYETKTDNEVIQITQSQNINISHIKEMNDEILKLEQ